MHIATAVFGSLRSTASILASITLMAVTQTVFANEVVNPSFETNETTGGAYFPAGAGDWDGDATVIVGAENGITPFDGVRMLRYLYTTETAPSGGAGASESIQLVDVTDDAAFIASGTAIASASFYANRVAGDAQTDTQFDIYLAAYDGVPSSFPSQFNNSELATATFLVSTDADPSTWQLIQVDLLLPAATDFIALFISALENVSDDASDPEFDGHYADQVSLLVSGPIPTLPTTWGRIKALGR